MFFDLFNKLAGNKIIIDRHLLSHRLEASLVAGKVKDDRFGFYMRRDRSSAFMSLMPFPLPAGLEDGLGNTLRGRRHRSLLNNSFQFRRIEVRSQCLLDGSLRGSRFGDELFTALPK